MVDVLRDIHPSVSAVLHVVDMLCDTHPTVASVPSRMSETVGLA